MSQNLTESCVKAIKKVSRFPSLKRIFVQRLAVNNNAVSVPGKTVNNPLEYSNRIILVLFDFCGDIQQINFDIHR